MITFTVVKETHGWAVRTGARMKTPFWKREDAIREAHCLAQALRGHGECAEVIFEGSCLSDPLGSQAAVEHTRRDTRFLRSGA